ncbi:MAG: DUF6273 domain-containing protein [Eubacteriales bacterium]|nr:DUF6273 domain-containing protein [Eubacteriales bacterium]
MASIRCKFCGAEMSVGQNEGMATCSICGGKQSLPLELDYARSNLFVRGNHFRMTRAYLKGVRAFDRILSDFEDDLEAHFCRALCRYGVTYDIPNKPILGRTLELSFLLDSDVRTCLQATDDPRNEYFRISAQRIFEAQQQIISAAAQIPPYDIYIVTDDSPKSVSVATDLFMQLTSREYTVYYLQAVRDQQLRQPEVYAYAALRSARAMILVGTDAMQFENIDVRNAFERFIDIQAQDQSRVLIPCYRDIDSFDLPEELSYVPSLDLAKINFMPSLLSALHSAMIKGSPLITNESANANADSLLARAYLFLEDGDFLNASRYLERVLDMDAKCAPAYIGKLMVERSVTQEEQLGFQSEPLDGDKNYERALRFANEEYKEKIEGYDCSILERIKLSNIERIYSQNVAAMSTASSEKELLDLESKFIDLGEYSNAPVMARDCRKKAAQARIKANEEQQLLEQRRSEYMEHKRKIKLLNDGDEAKLRPMLERRANLIATFPNKKDGGLFGTKRRAAIHELRRLQSEIDVVRLPYVERNRKEIISGDVFELGVYVQFGRKDYASAPIKWRIIDFYDGKALALSQNILTTSPFDTEGSSSWNRSFINEMLNHEAIEYALSGDEQALICPNSNGDKFFLLTQAEIEQAYSAETDRIAKGTTYAHLCGLLADSDGHSAWWLSDKGDENGCVKVVEPNGCVNSNGVEAAKTGVGVRPAMWLDALALEKYLLEHPQSPAPNDEYLLALAQFQRLEGDAQAYLLKPTSKQGWQDIINRYEEFYIYRSFAFQCAEADFYANGMIEGVKHGAMHIRSSKVAIDGFIRNIEQARKLIETDAQAKILAHLEQEGMRRLSKLTRH